MADTPTDDELARYRLAAEMFHRALHGDAGTAEQQLTQVSSGIFGLSSQPALVAQGVLKEEDVTFLSQLLAAEYVTSEGAGTPFTQLDRLIPDGRKPSRLRTGATSETLGNSAALGPLVERLNGISTHIAEVDESHAAALDAYRQVVNGVIGDMNISERAIAVLATAQTIETEEVQARIDGFAAPAVRVISVPESAVLPEATAAERVTVEDPAEKPAPKDLTERPAKAAEEEGEAADPGGRVPAEGIPPAGDATVVGSELAVVAIAELNDGRGAHQRLRADGSIVAATGSAADAAFSMGALDEVDTDKITDITVLHQLRRAYERYELGTDDEDFQTLNKVLKGIDGKENHHFVRSDHSRAIQEAYLGADGLNLSDGLSPEEHKAMVEAAVKAAASFGENLVTVDRAAKADDVAAPPMSTADQQALNEKARAADQATRPSV